MTKDAKKNDLTESSDGKLVRMTLGGDHEAYRELVGRYQGHVYGLAYSLVGNWAEAQDIAQETFIRAYSNLDQLREPEKFAAWLRRVAFGVAMDWLKTFRPKLFEQLDGRVDLDHLEIPDFQPGPPEIAQQRELADAVLSAVASLPPKYRVPLTMFHLDGLSYKKVADFLDIPLGTAKSMIHRAKAKLKAALPAAIAKEMTPMVQEVFNEHKLPEEFARKIIETHWPEVTGMLAPELAEDRYVKYHLRQADPIDCLVVARSPGAQDVMRTYADNPMVWLEAHTEKARELLGTLPAGRELFVLVGTALGLRLVQQEMSGAVETAGIFCILERHRFRPVKKHTVRKFEKVDRSALESYPEHRDLEFDLRCFDEDSESYYGCFENGRLVGYSIANCDFPLCVHLRPEFRGQGYGSSLLSAVAEEVLNKDGFALFNADMKDMAELRLALTVGFVPHRVEFYFQGKRQPH